MYQPKTNGQFGHTITGLLQTLLMGVLLMLCSPYALALSTDSQQPMHVEADRADIDDVKGISIYTGNVVVTQGSMVIRAHKMTVHHPKKQLEKIIAEGTRAKRATYTQRPDGKDKNVNAEAQKMIYFADSEIVHLYTNAELWQGGDRFTGEKIIYNTLTEEMKASSDGKTSSGSPGRITTTIQPRQDKQ